MKWRTLGWLTFILSLALSFFGSIPFAVPDAAMMGSIDWEFVPDHLVGSLWYSQSCYFLLPSGVILWLASYSFFAKWRGRSLGWPFRVYILLEAVLGLLYIGALVLLAVTGYFPIGQNSVMSADYSSVWLGVGFMATVLLPALLAWVFCLVEAKSTPAGDRTAKPG